MVEKSIPVSFKISMSYISMPVVDSLHITNRIFPIGNIEVLAKTDFQLSIYQHQFLRQFMHEI